MPSPYPGIALAGLEMHRWHVHAIQCAPQNRHHVGSGPTHRHTSNTFITPRRTAPDVSDMSADISSNTPMTMARPAFHYRHCHCCRSTRKAPTAQQMCWVGSSSSFRRCRAHNDTADDSFRRLRPLALDESAQAPPVCLQLAAIKAGALPSFRRLRFII